jgi:hypothetical protein
MTMHTSDHAGESGSSRKGSVLVLGLCVLIGLAYLGIGLATDNTGFGVAGLAIMLGYAALLALGRRRSEALGMLAGDLGDERRVALTQRALAFTANVLVVVLVGGFLVTMATSSDLAGAFAGLCAVAGVSFAAGIVWYSRRG